MTLVPPVAAKALMIEPRPTAMSAGSGEPPFWQLVAETFSFDPSKARSTLPYSATSTASPGADSFDIDMTSPFPPAEPAAGYEVDGGPGVAIGVGEVPIWVSGATDP